MRKPDGPSLLAITSSAMMIPVLPEAEADTAPEETRLALRYSQYREDDLKSHLTFNPDPSRMEVDVAQFHLSTPLGERWALLLDIDHEDVSGASPWFVGVGSDGSPRVVLSGASIRDTRTGVSVTTRYYLPDGSAGFNYSGSREDDYESDALGVDRSWVSEDEQTTWSVAGSYAEDKLTPTQGSTPTDVLRADRETGSLWGGASFILSRQLITRIGLSFTYRDGYLTDPYKAVDHRPSHRREWALSGGLRYHLPAVNASLATDYRYFNDDWGVQSHALEFSWHQDIGMRLQLSPRLRYYSQSEADFFSVVADPDRRYHADDHRLAAFGALSLGLDVSCRLGDWTLSLGIERYRNDNSWGLFGGEAAPALVDAWRATVGIDLVTFP